MHIAETTGNGAVCGAKGTIWSDLDWKAADADQWFVRCKRCDQMTSQPGSLDALKTKRRKHALHVLGPGGIVAIPNAEAKLEKLAGRPANTTVHIARSDSDTALCGAGGKGHTYRPPTQRAEKPDETTTRQRGTTSSDRNQGYSPKRQ